MPKRKLREETGLTYTRGEAERLARGLVSEVDREYFERKVEEFKAASGTMLVALLKQGQIAAELRSRSRSFLTLLYEASGTHEEQLDNLADFWEFFQDELPRTDIYARYYLQISRAIRVIQATWKEETEVGEAAIEAARELISELNPKEVGSGQAAEHLRKRFGIFDPGNKPFVNEPIPPLHSMAEIEQYAAARFHDVVQPYFIEYARGRYGKPALPPREEMIEPESEPAPKKQVTMLYLNIKVEGELEGKCLKRVVAKVSEALKKEGLEFKITRAHAYPQK